MEEEEERTIVEGGDEHGEHGEHGEHEGQEDLDTEQYGDGSTLAARGSNRVARQQDMDERSALEREVCALRQKTQAMRSEWHRTGPGAVAVALHEAAAAAAAAAAPDGDGFAGAAVDPDAQVAAAAAAELEVLYDELMWAQKRGEEGRARELKHRQVPALERQVQDTAAQRRSGGDSSGRYGGRYGMAAAWALDEEREGRGARGADANAAAAGDDDEEEAPLAITASDDGEKGGDEEGDVVGAAHVAEVVAAMTGIPVARLTQDAQERLLHVEAELGRAVIGQPEAVHAVAGAAQLAWAGVQPPDRPIGVFLLLGPTGVGKTHLAKSVAAALFDGELLRIDMSEYREYVLLALRHYCGSKIEGVLVSMLSIG